MNQNSRGRKYVFALCSVVAALALAGLIAGCAAYKAGVTRIPSASANAMRADGIRTFSIPQSPELWIIARGETEPVEPSSESPGSGLLLAKVNQQEVPMPLKHTDVRASISGYIGAVQVTQQFQNPYSGKIEAVYVFPLPHNAAINEFVMTIGERHIRGIIRERKEAEQIYAQAKRQGYVASLLTQERPNIFRQAVANIEPGKEIDVEIKYFHTLEYVDGWYEFVFPMVVGPQFNPPGTTAGIGAVPRGATSASGQSNEVQYLHPSERTSHDISLRVELNAGVPVEDVQCQTHKIIRESRAPERLSATLAPDDNLPNRDFVLRFRVAGDQIKSSLVTAGDQQGGYFTLMLYPPKELAALRRNPVELVFVLDCSGSMNGRPIAQAKAAVERGLNLLQPGDSFQIISFSMQASQLGEAPLEATPENIQRGLQYLRVLDGEGGTMMIEGIKAALSFPHDPNRLRFVCFLTDGYIGNETEILAEIHHRLGDSRIFSFGIGSAINRYLIQEMGNAGRGAVAYLGLHDDAAKIVEDFFERISHPALTNVKIDWGGWQVTEIFPNEIPDLFVGRSVILTGRYAGQPTGLASVQGSSGHERLALPITSTPVNEALSQAAVPYVWARNKIAGLAAQSVYQPGEQWAAQIRQVALDYDLLSDFTAFIAVDSTRVTAGTGGTTVPVAVPVPEGTKYETTVKDKQEN